MANDYAEVKGFINGYVARFLPEAAKGVDVSYQYDITGAGIFTFVIKDGTIKVVEGPFENPTVKFTESAETYCKINRGEVESTIMFMQRKVKMDGDMGIGAQFLSYFAPGDIAVK